MKLATYFLLAVRIAVGGLLLVAGVLKILDDSTLRDGVGLIPWLPVWAKLLVIRLLPVVEVVLGGAFAAGLLLRWSGSATSLLYLVFFGYAIYGWATGMEGECGCFGGVGGASFGWQMTLRNALLLAGAAIVTARSWRPTKEPAPVEQDVNPV